MIRSGRLCHCPESHAWVSREVTTQLAGLAAVNPRIVTPEFSITLTITTRRESEDSDGSLLAITVRQTEVLNSGLIGTIRTRRDKTTCPDLDRRHGLVLDTAIDTLTNHVLTSPTGQ